ncbi:hypothetical protein BGZ76_008689 [Entomortierella beljakovae]|nr:hypothetical protein BGZ76_008689 [Entomortierella beljakovae]
MSPTGMLSTSCSTDIQPHGYLYVLDIPRIHRMLRPIKAKIAAIHLVIKSTPSFGYAPVNTTGNRDDSSSDDESVEDTARNSRSKQSQQRRMPGTQGRRGAQRLQAPSTHPDRSAAQLDSNESTSAASATHIQIGSDTLVRRFRSSLVDQFRDVIEKIWWQPFCEDYDLPLNSIPSSVLGLGLEPNSYTLGKLSAFSAGRLIAHFQEHDSARMEKYYNLMPAHMRRADSQWRLGGNAVSEQPFGCVFIGKLSFAPSSEPPTPSCRHFGGVIR